jgi:hypothetical protein
LTAGPAARAGRLRPESAGALSKKSEVPAATRRSRLEPQALKSGAVLAWVCLQSALMSLVKLLGFTTMGCGCVLGRYREVGTNREVTYIEEKGTSCLQRSHLRNQPVSADRVAHGFQSGDAVRAS